MFTKGLTKSATAVFSSDSTMANLPDKTIANENELEFAKTYEPAEIEGRLRQFWEQGGFFKANPNPQKPPYTIVIPPPNVTSDLHVGHMLNNTLQDVLIRWHRARGFEACWIPGTDHASIATEARVTKMLEGKGIDKRKIGREKFLEHAWSWKSEVGGRIVTLLKALGISCDWSREVFTMDEKYSRSVLEAFVTLYKKGLIYRGTRLVNWCPFSQSVISDEEVNNEERPGNFYHIHYKFAEDALKSHANFVNSKPNISVQESNAQKTAAEEKNINETKNNESPEKHKRHTEDSIIVATTRPETIFGDLAIAIHPDDENLRHLIGCHVIVPICERKIPIIADPAVEKDFGTGCLKVTPSHDPTDYEIGERHKLGHLNIMNKDATLNNNAPSSYVGLSREDARKKVVQDLKSQQLLEKLVPMTHVVGISERGGIPIEYYLSEQWYIRMNEFANMALEATRQKEVVLVPAFQEKVWEHWLTNIQDWCISRQLWWGHQIPVHTCQSCQHLNVAVDRPEKCEKCGSKNLVQDPDVLDTWASSWLWPFAVHNWANPSAKEKADLEYFYPTDVIVTGTDIIFFWIARMVMAGKYFTGKAPFKYVYFTGLLRDKIGRKMSKSLGNFPDTFELIGKFGTDALRFSLVNQLVTGLDIRWNDDSCEIGRTFANKIWNATRYLLLSCKAAGLSPKSITVDELNWQQEDPTLAWIITEYKKTLQKSFTAIDSFEFADYSKSVYEFVWMRYCDWFIELIKPRIQGENAQSQQAKETLKVALQVLEGSLRLLHPLMPYITEEIWQRLGENSRAHTSVGLQKLQLPPAAANDTTALAQMDLIQSLIGGVRKVRGELNIHPATTINVTIAAETASLSKFLTVFESLAKVKVTFGSQKPMRSASLRAGEIKYFVELGDDVNLAEERAKISKRMEKCVNNIKSCESKLKNEQFVNSAPQAVVEGARKQLEQNQNELQLLTETMEALAD